MLPYIYVFSITSLLSICLLIMQDKRFDIIKSLIHFLIALILTSLFLIRDHGIGIDTYSYVKMIDDIGIMHNYQDLLTYSFANEFEVGFLTLLYVLKIFDNSNLILSICAFIVFYNYSRFVQILNLNPLIAYSAIFSFFGIYFFSFNILRQMMALSFVMLGMAHLFKGNSKSFFIFILFATLFHYTSLICFLFYFIFKFNDFIFKFRFIFFAILIIFSKLIFMLLASYYPRYSDYMTMRTMDNNIGVILFLFYLLIYFCSEFLNFYFKNKIFKTCAIIFIIYLALQGAFYLNDIYNYGATRIVLYFLWPSVLLVICFFSSVRDINLRSILFIIFYGLLCFYFFYTLLNLDYSYIPFHYKGL